MPCACGLSRAHAVSRLDLPEPDGPTRSMMSPRSMPKDRLSNTVRSSSAGDCAGTTQDTDMASKKGRIFIQSSRGVHVGNPSVHFLYTRCGIITKAIFGLCLS